MKINLMSKCSLDIEQNVEFEMSVLITPSKSLISSHWVTFFKKSVDNFETAHKTCSILVWGADPLSLLP